MDDMYKSIKAFLYDRTSSPLFGAFIISWSVINYRVILTIFSGEGLANKFTIIDQLYSVTLFDQSYHFLGLFYYGFMLPGLATISYIYLYPLLAKPVYEHSLKKQKELREIKQKEEGNRLLSQGESREIYMEMAEAENKYYLQEDKYRKQVSSLLSKNKELEKGREVTPAPTYPLSASYIQEKIDGLKKNEFTLSDVVDEKDWVNLTDAEKRSLGKKFNKVVKGGGYLGVSHAGEDSSNHAVYKKVAEHRFKSEEQKLSGLKESVLKKYVDTAAEYLTKEEFTIKGLNPIKVDLALDELVKDKYLRKLPNRNYTLETKGKKYLAENKMLE